mmetsp:Transcript_40402/g.63070  ORF Transcript_40402/g.63070 Transcript_40402/m.63070 type:complete len:230 (+) Transcript_40402:322-1011(+)|eukprot:CAMPEP_0184301238 /NCGR_PEP_ID=MMETSP1049-20130417/11485_1 /TAXON_ID=77928 /ORGANISM="Proteomonas sulcata, Strain CCMP704" /LENGTH=229 /DNA_ID=CAMNT_0026612193 /DNA_START=310 /DNA_END=999 /DNA_ORIENTATION=+
MTLKKSVSSPVLTSLPPGLRSISPMKGLDGKSLADTSESSPGWQRESVKTSTLQGRLAVQSMIKRHNSAGSRRGSRRTSQSLLPPSPEGGVSGSRSPEPMFGQWNMLDMGESRESFRSDASGRSTVELSPTSSTVEPDFWAHANAHQTGENHGGKQHRKKKETAKRRYSFFGTLAEEREFVISFEMVAASGIMLLLLLTILHIFLFHSPDLAQKRAGLGPADAAAGRPF